MSQASCCPARQRLLNRNQSYQVRLSSTTSGLKKSGKNSIQGTRRPNNARNVGFSISHRSPQTHNLRTHVLYVVPDIRQTFVLRGTHALVGVLPRTTSRRNTTPKRAARHMHGLTSSTAPSVGEVEVLVRPPRSTPECRTWYDIRHPNVVRGQRCTRSILRRRFDAFDVPVMSWWCCL